MEAVEVEALQHSSNLLLSQIHRKGRYIHPLRTGRKYKCLENRVLGPLLEKNNIKLLPHKGSVFPTYTILHVALILSCNTTQVQKDHKQHRSNPVF